MNTTIQALQGLYVKMGGSLTDTYSAIADGAQVGNYTTIPDMIEACTQLAGSGGGGGSSLPSVTSADNGDVLTVVEGAWAKADPPTAETLVVTFTASGGVYSADKTLSEINTAWATNKNIIGYNSETGYTLPLVYCNADAAIFSCVSLTAAQTYTAMSMQITKSSGLIYDQVNVELATT